MMQYTQKPLCGKKIVVTRSRKYSIILSKKLRALGADVVEFPTLDFSPPNDTKALDKSIKTLASYDWLVFTSINAVKYFSKRLKFAGKSISSLESIKIAAVGKKTEEELGKRGATVDFVPKNYLTNELAETLPEVNGKMILIPRSNVAGRDLVKKLRGRLAKVTEVVAYQTNIPTMSEQKSTGHALEDADLFLFTSSSSVINFVKLLGPDKSVLRFKISAACIGPVTAHTAKKLGMTVSMVASTHTVEELIREVVKTVGTNE